MLTHFAVIYRGTYFNPATAQLKQIGLTEIQIGVLSRYIDGHSYERIAEFYNLKKCSVRTIVTRAQQRPLLQRVITERKRRDTTPFI